MNRRQSKCSPPSTPINSWKHSACGGEKGEGEEEGEGEGRGGGGPAAHVRTMMSRFVQARDND